MLGLKINVEVCVVALKFLHVNKLHVSYKGNQCRKWASMCRIKEIIFILVVTGFNSTLVAKSKPNSEKAPCRIAQQELPDNDIPASTRSSLYLALTKANLQLFDVRVSKTNFSE